MTNGQRPNKEMSTRPNKQAIWNAQIVKRAIVDSFKKLNPRKMMGNPVMFVVEVGSVLTTLQLIRGIIAPIPGVTNTGLSCRSRCGSGSRSCLQTSPRRWRKGRGKAQADNLRRAKTETIAHRVLSGSQTEDVPHLNYGKMISLLFLPASLSRRW